jgi:hypothetical protein
MGIKEYPCPAGGCLLTEPSFVKRMQDLIRHNPDFTVNDVKLLKLGRHFRISPNTKLIVGRNREENNRLSLLVSDEDILIDAQDLPGPLAILRGKPSNGEIKKALSITAAFSKLKNFEMVRIRYKKHPQKDYIYVETSPAKREELKEIWIN